MRVLHVGCGRATLPDIYNTFDEVRLDIDPDVNPDVVASMTQLGEIGKFDSVYSSHNLEHLYPNEVPVALSEFRRVLEPNGFLIVLTPDIEGLTICGDVLYESEAGPITALDLIYGHRSEIPDNPNMAHHTGFTRDILQDELEAAGFEFVVVGRGSLYSLWAIACPQTPPKDKMAEISKLFFHSQEA